ncbi:hypothetical protein [Streptomyces sp. MI02-7b]|uniref:hypothetical protein n=1 Tax=Streptomyces sp. MI02-7b TaxID=462941 RepID=UPI0029BE015E|nr:hypothetical protein [Streptomyces sp. MI02-7b]MDX3077847.1 hypothetical protein [Streptomyces sp. MI02-7b]
MKRITAPRDTPTDRAIKRVWLLENLIHHPRTATDERAAAERALKRAIDAARASGQITATPAAGPGTGEAWQGYGLPPIRFGAKYEQVKGLRLKDIAAIIREDIKLARKIDRMMDAPGAVAVVDALTPLAAMPKQIKVSVRTDWSSTTGAIRVKVYNLLDGWGFVQKRDRITGKKQWVSLARVPTCPGRPRRDPRGLQLRRVGRQGRALQRQLLRSRRMGLA